MKNVLFLEEGPGFGGALMSLKYFLESANSLDYQFFLISNYQQNYIQQSENVKNITVIPRKRIYGKGSLLETFLSKLVGKKAGPAAYLIDRYTYCNRYIKEIEKYIKQNKIDIVHLNNWPLLNDGGLHAAKNAGIPAIMHIRGFEYEGKLIGRLMKKADYIIAISEYIKERVNQLGILDNKISVIPNAINVKTFIQNANGAEFRKEFGMNNNIKIIGMPGCLVNWKGHKFFLKACADLLKENKILGMIIGDTPDGDPSYKTELQEFTQHIGIGDKIIFTGHRRDIASAMDACDIIVHASTAPEPFGRVIIEAMALGKPVVATSQGGPMEIITDGVDGLLVSPSDSGSIADAILKYLTNEKMCHDFGRMAANKVVKKYDVKNYVKSILTIYGKVLN